jgi:4-methyl-5(b-hydroxyethyl)-thiazole monophosphate biosynthesis
MATALVPLAEGFDDVEAVAVIDVLRRGGVEVTVASVHDTLAVKSAHGIEMKADALFSDVGDNAYDVIVLPGGGAGTENLKADERLLERLRRQRAENGLLAAICAAPTVLVAAHVPEPGVHVTCYPTCQMELDRPWSPAQVVADKGVITGQGPGTALLFALVVLQHLLGDSVAQRIARSMVTDVLS